MEKLDVEKKGNFLKDTRNGNCASVRPGYELMHHISAAFHLDWEVHGIVQPFGKNVKKQVHVTPSKTTNLHTFKFLFPNR